jgi:FAD/FMN-containing dehydrogenase
VLRPADAAEVATLVQLCARHAIPLVPQGGNTGLVLGSVPDQQGNAVVLSLRRLNRIRAVDPVNNTMTVEAGCVLQHLQEQAAAVNACSRFRWRPKAAAPSAATSTNAGGTGVLRYGNTRELCLGLEVVTAEGEI